jgi:hypothetical protein
MSMIPPSVFRSPLSRIALPLALVIVCIAPQAAMALPSYSRQTGVPCAQCHTAGFGPQLTPYGRAFKLNGYVWGNSGANVPLSLMTVLGYTHTSGDLSEAPEHYDTNNNFAMNELTGFLAGRLAPHLGSFVEVAYSGTERNVAWGAFDLRSAWSGSLGNTSYVAGITLNNNPSVTDLWNSTPVWSFPYTGSELAPTPAAAPILYDGISETVLGPSLYTMLDNHYYLEVGAYKSLGDSLLKKVGLSADDNLHLKGLTPYARAVAQYDNGPHDFSIGMTMLSTRMRPDPSQQIPDSYTDIGLDSSYQYVAANHSISAHVAFVQEKQQLHASFAAGESDGVDNHLSSTRFDITYGWKQNWAGSLGLFSTSGTLNAARYAPADTEGSASGFPNSNGYLLQLEYIPFGKQGSPGGPWSNARFGVQYTHYSKFNGGTSNYDGFGRNSRDNNTLFLFAWLAI